MPRARYLAGRAGRGRPRAPFGRSKGCSTAEDHSAAFAQGVVLPPRTHPQATFTNPIDRLRPKSSRTARDRRDDGHVLYHSGYSTILRESGRFGRADRRRGASSSSGWAAILCLPACRSRSWRSTAEPPGDSFVVNNPYQGGNPHVPDFVALTPGFFEGELIGFGVSIAHKTDVGGLVPGSSGAGAREIFHDGMLIPPVRYQTSAGINEIVEAVIRRTAHARVVLGDLRVSWCTHRRRTAGATLRRVFAEP